MKLKFFPLFALALGFTQLLPAAIIGTNTPAQSLTIERIKMLPGRNDRRGRNI